MTSFWRFMSSPSSTRPSSPSSVRPPSRKSGSHGRQGKPGVPWWISAVFFVGLLRVLLGVLILYGLSLSVAEPMPGWFNALIFIHGAAMIVTLVFILNGFGWARLAWLVLAVAQLAFDQGVITRYILMVDIAVLVVLVIPGSNRYMARCAAVRSPAV